MLCYKYSNLKHISNSFCFRDFLLRSLPLLRWETNNFFIKSADELKENSQIYETKTTKKKKTSQSKNKYLIPPLNSKYIEEIQTVTAISVGFTHFAWIKFAISTLAILDWNAKPLPKNFWTALHEPNLLSFAYNTRKSLPVSDLYAMETFSLNLRQWERKVNEIHFLSMLIVLIHGIDAEKEEKTKVVFQEKRVLDKVFEICIGHERVATSDITESILEEVNKANDDSEEITNDNFNSLIQINSKFLDFFNASHYDKKEDLSLVFLLALSIIKVHFHKIIDINLLSKKKTN